MKKSLAIKCGLSAAGTLFLWRIFLPRQLMLFASDEHGLTRTLFCAEEWASVCSALCTAARSIRIYNPGKDILSALKMLILRMVGLQIRPSGSKQYPYEVYVLRKSVNRSSESSQLYSGEAVNQISTGRQVLKNKA